MLGEYGLPETRIQAMTLPELEGFLRQAALLRHGQTLPPLLLQTASALPPAPKAGGHTQTFISKRRKK